MYQSLTTNLMVTSVEETILFYQKILEFAVVASVPNDVGKLNFAILEKDNLMLMLQEQDNFIDEYPSLATDQINASISLYLVVDHFNQLYQQIKSKTTLLVDLHITFYGKREFAIADNNGYVITIAEQDN